MVTLFTQIQQISDKLEQDKAQNPELLYHIDIKFNNQINLFIYTTNNSYEVNLDDIIDKSLVDKKYIDNELYQEDEYYKELFKTKIGGYTRRFANIFNEAEKIATPCPVVTFYSYKGGVGRTTTLAFFASHYAKQGKKVMILDCDFEAPGLSNYFDLKANSNKNGIVEYLYAINNQASTNWSNYIYDNIRTEYSGKGKIYVMSSGNLSDEFVMNLDETKMPIKHFKTHKEHYLQALSRLDLASPEIIAQQFSLLIKNLYAEYQPDVILLDSRTGFNDVLTNIVLRISKLVVGFFGANTQTEAGIGHILDIVAENKTDLLLVCPMLPNYDASRIFRKAIENINEYANKHNQDPNYDIFRVLYDPRLALIGIDDVEDKEIFVEIIDTNSYPSVNETKVKLFDFLSKKVDSFLENENTTTQNLTLLDLKTQILENLYNYFQDEKSLYGEKSQIDENTLEYFYFRDKINDIFKKDFFLIKGSKGTGKSLLYEVLQNKSFAKELQTNAQVKGNYIFVNIISNPESKNVANKNKFLDTSSNNLRPENLGLDIDTYWKRFWITYTWNAILLDSDLISYQRKQEFLQALPINNITDENSSSFEGLLKDDKFNLIQKELRDIDTFLQAKQTNLVVMYDYLDYLVKPNEWLGIDSKIAPLFNFWRNNTYSNILPKIFIRADLYVKISGVNTNNIDNSAISIEWTVEELFSYFFKIVFVVNKQNFIKYINGYKGSSEFSEKVVNLIEKNVNQVPTNEQDILKSLVEIFFGSLVDNRNESFGFSYDWFYKNLKNADNTISLRPFLELIKFAMQVALAKEVPLTHKEYLDLNDIIDRKGKDQADTPILSGNYFANGTIRSLCVKRYFEDLKKEAGNDFLRHLEDTLKNNDQADRFRKSFLYENQLVDLINLVKKLHNFEISVIDAKELLIANGIIKKNFNQPTSYSFAFLYKYYFGLRSR
jgi:MinD-like ATPase involved in chromosome partitioning or flagellar assembly